MSSDESLIEMLDRDVIGSATSLRKLFDTYHDNDNNSGYDIDTDMYIESKSDDIKYQQFNIGFFRFDSIDEIKNKQYYYKKKFIDIAHYSYGLGLYIVLAYIPQTDNFFFRLDGNATEKIGEEYYNKYYTDTYIPANFPHIKIDDKYRNVNDSLILACLKKNIIFLQNIKESVQYSFEDIIKAISN